MGIVRQACFLGATLGPDKIWIDGEDDAMARDRIKLLAAGHLPDQCFDLVVNVDSLTEVPLAAALEYTAWIAQHARVFLSINHEVNPFSVREIAQGWAVHRSEQIPFPLRPGYIEETYFLKFKPYMRRFPPPWTIEEANGACFVVHAVPAMWRSLAAGAGTASQAAGRQLDEDQCTHTIDESEPVGSSVVVGATSVPPQLPLEKLRQRRMKSP
jgi:hypothetical protein